MNLLDFEYLEKNLNTQSLYGSDSCIANLFLLQEKYSTWLKIHNNTLFRYYYGSENRRGYAFPLAIKNVSSTSSSDSSYSLEWLKNALDFIIEDSKLEKRTLSFCLITQEQKQLLDLVLEKYFKLKVSWKTNRDDCDYIYLQENLSNLPGSHYQKKRNHISRFIRTYGDDWEFKSFPENALEADILALSQKWLEEKNDAENESLKLEHEAIIRALENAELLRLRGGVLYVGGVPAAMTLGAPISDSVFDVIYEKAVGEYEKNGAYAVINQQFSKYCGSYLYINREEDMGIEGLRKAKLSYKPTIVLEKFYGKID